MSAPSDSSLSPSKVSQGVGRSPSRNRDVGGGKPQKPRSRPNTPKKANSAARSLRVIRDIFEALCKSVDLATHFDFGKEPKLDGDSLPKFLEEGQTSLHNEYKLSYLEAKLSDQSNILHYLVSAPIRDDEGYDEEEDGSEQDTYVDGHEIEVDDDLPPNEGDIRQNQAGDSDDPMTSDGYDSDEDLEFDLRFRRRCSFITWLLRRYPDILGERNNAKQTPLCLLITSARGMEISSRNPGLETVTSAFEKLLEDDRLRGYIAMFLNDPHDTDRGTLIHLAVEYFGSRFQPLLHLVDPKTMSIQNKEGKTPLHIAVDVQLWKNDDLEQRIALVQGLLKLCNAQALTRRHGSQNWISERRESPYRYMMSQKKKWDDALKSRGAADVQKYFDLCVDHLKNAYMGLEDHAIIDHLHAGHKKHYLRVDLREAIGTNVLENIEGYLGTMNVDTVLKEVWLPQQLLTAQLRSRDGGSCKKCPPKVTEDICKVYKNYGGVFDWFRAKGVKKIIKLTVEDNELLPHSDEEIVKALKDIEVDVWNWRQDDLSSDTIISAAKTARHLYLYSTGKKAVLQNWCDYLGPKLREVEEVDLIIDLRKRPVSGGQEDYEAIYRPRLLKAFPQLKDVNKLRIDVDSLKNEASKARESDNQNRGATHKNGTTTYWVRRMKQFAQFIHTIASKQRILPDKDQVKIAIVDDGVTPELVASCNSGRIAGGMSFDRSNQDAGHGRHHFPSTTGHGTKMADCILEIFPLAKLYIARIETILPPGEEEVGPWITSDSAAEGISWAVEQNVDIILMSWTIEENAESQEGLEKMKKALQLASDQNILMFCAAKDLGGDYTQNPGYPSGFSLPIFCVGGATASGQRSDKIGTQTVDFLCPESFPGSRQLRSYFPKEPTGSSIAAALAAGVAGLLLYCISLGNCAPFKTYSEEDQDGETERMQLRRHKTMKDTLEGMISKNNQFLLAYKYFAIEEVKPWEDGGKEQLRDVIRIIQTEKKKAMQQQ